MPTISIGLHENNEPRTPRTPGPSNTSRTPRTPRTPAQFLVHPSPNSSKTFSRLDANAPPFVPTKLTQSPHGDNAETEQAALKSRILATFDRSGNTSDSGWDSSDTDDPNAEYVRLKMQIANLTSRRPPGDNTESAFVQDLRAKLDVVKKNYFFDEKDAEAHYQLEREKANTLALQSRLRGNKDTSFEIPQSRNAPKQRPPNLQQPIAKSPLAVRDLFDNESEDSAGGLFELLDTPTTEINEQGTTVRILDMALPRHWSGRTPKTLLSEVVVKADRYAAISYRIVSGLSRAKRASVNIRWEGRKMGEFVMEDVACYDEAQAEQYIATVALHTLAFPTTQGFATGASSLSGSQTFFRLLPAVYRDLWDDLEVARKAKEDIINRALWAKLRTVLEPKLDIDRKVCELRVLSSYVALI
jgi:ATP-dependent RNA helicase DHX29